MKTMMMNNIALIIRLSHYLKRSWFTLWFFAIIVAETPTLFAQTNSTIPEQVDHLVSRFLEVKNTQINIENVTEWAFSGRVDSLEFAVILRDSTHFRLFMDAQNMGIVGFGEKLYTVNHGQRQIIVEHLNPHDLIKRFLGPLFSDVVFRSQVEDKLGYKLTFNFSDPYSEWSSAVVWVDKSWLVQRMDLTDVEQNLVRVKLNFFNMTESFYFEDVLSNSYQYQIVDLTTIPDADSTAGKP